ncbi:MAG: sigma 54-interacting transcriptional regulator [Vicinamibacteria bacterium]|nr:sigma 54-interacting transcriptional regulator [Vicinamibacteria bacterium]
MILASPEDLQATLLLARRERRETHGSGPRLAPRVGRKGKDMDDADSEITGPSTGFPEVDRLIGGILAGDNVVWEVDSGAPVDSFIAGFISSCARENAPLVYVSFNRSPQTIVGRYAALMQTDRFILIDCFSSGKGDNDAVFLDYFKSAPDTAIQVETPGDPVKLQEALASIEAKIGPNVRYVFDSLTGMLDLWRDQDVVLRFFGHFCPRLYNLRTIAYWILEKEAHGEPFLAKLRHITQVVIDAAVRAGDRTLAVRMASGRRSVDLGAHHHFDVVGDRIALVPETREGRELSLLTRMGEALSSALEPTVFFERTLQVLASELGMLRGTLSLHDKAADKLKIVAAHGLSPAERARGQYAVGEGVTGRVLETGNPEIVADIAKDARFLNRTRARAGGNLESVAFICVPVKCDDQIVGALSADRPFAPVPVLEQDLRLLQTVAAIIAQVVKINRIAALDKDALIVRDERMLDELRKRYRLDDFVGQSDAIRGALAVAATAAKSRAAILVTGETGTGKEMIANVIHYRSGRAEGPFIKVNCGALPDTLLESELFGHVKGAFTGALQSRKGRFEAATRGTLFLDEVAEMSPYLQVRLLRVLQDGTFEPLGSNHTVRVDVRIVAATNKILREEVRQGRFREDLYYRLNVIPIVLPPLRERREDVPPLVHHFLGVFSRENEKAVTHLSQEVLDLLIEYPWPGNVRELENCIERAVILSPAETLLPSTLPSEILHHRRERAHRRAEAAADENDVRRTIANYCRRSGDLAALRETLLNAVEETIIRRGVDSGLSQRELAVQLNISRMTLRKKMRELGVK